MTAICSFSVNCFCHKYAADELGTLLLTCMKEGHNTLVLLVCFMNGYRQPRALQMVCASEDFLQYRVSSSAS